MIPRDVLLEQLHRDFPAHVSERIEDFLPVAENYTANDDPAEVQDMAQGVWAGLCAVARRLPDDWGAEPTSDDREVMLLAGHLLDTLPAEVGLRIVPLCLEEFIRYGAYENCDISLNHCAVDFLQRALLSERQQATLLDLWCWLGEVRGVTFEITLAWAFRISGLELICPATARYVKDRYAALCREAARGTRLHGRESDLSRVATMSNSEIADWFRGLYRWFGPEAFADESPSLETLSPDAIRHCVRLICDRAKGGMG